MPATAYKHFQEDIERAKSLADLARQLSSSTNQRTNLHDDLARSAWMFGVGAADAYFCDAFADLLAASLICKTRQPTLSLNEKILSKELPIGAYFGGQQIRQNWKWRLAARKLIERDNILSIIRFKEVINPFLPTGRKLYGDVLDSWMKASDAKQRMFGITHRTYLSLNQNQKTSAKKAAKEKLESRFKAIFQRRHDCIHNCDRPKVSLKPISSITTVDRVITDIDYLVTKCNGHIDKEFRNYLIGAGCSSANVTHVGY